jgi:DNA-binding transcriptional MerR regulator
MSEIRLQRRPLYSIGTVARLTGVKADTLRVWERRYSLGASHRSPSGRRLFTQSDLEHLQLVAALVAAGTRIGDIAGSERRTLEVLLRSSGNYSAKVILERKPRILFVGDALCDWLDEHQGCLAGVDALLLPASLAQVSSKLLEDLEAVDGVVAEVGGLGEVSTQQLSALASALDTCNVLVLHRYSSQRWIRELEQRGYVAAEYPPDPRYLASYLSVSVAVKEASQGLESVGELAQIKPRLFDEMKLSQASKLQSVLDCECPKHIVELVRALANFEEYSASCSVENWQDASIHACLYAYTGQARWLMEKALMLITEGHAEQALEEEENESIAVAES